MKTLIQHKRELHDKILEIFDDYKCAIIQISTHDGGEVEIMHGDIKFDELEIKIEVS